MSNIKDLHDAVGNHVPHGGMKYSNKADIAFQTLDVVHDKPDNTRAYDLEADIKREEIGAKQFTQRIKTNHAEDMDRRDLSGVDVWNRISEDSDIQGLSAEVLEVLSNDPDGQSAAERDGFEVPAWELYDLEVSEVNDYEVGSYAVKGEAAWSGKREYENSGKCKIAVTSGFDSVAYDRKCRKTTKARAFHDIPQALDNSTGKRVRKNHVGLIAALVTTGKIESTVQDKAQRIESKLSKASQRRNARIASKMRNA